MSEHYPLPLQLESSKMVNGRRWYILLNDFSFKSSIMGETITAPKGFTTDMASIPKILQPIVQKDEGCLEASIIHDWLYSLSCDQSVTRHTADRVFLEAMTISGMGPIKRGWCYHAVRKFSKPFFRKRS